MRVAVINGPNLDMLGKREPEIYGNLTLDDLKDLLEDKARILNIEIEFFQSNFEGKLIEYIHTLRDKADGFLLNPAAFSHYSIALRDAVLAVGLPFVEVHISNIFKREEFRHKSYFSDIALGVISGLGFDGYVYALDWLVKVLRRGENQ
ncbi:type II 3-dehydroquinate dehydratase [Hippea maritima]|uniref:3-dehydroquinate dehydratase n=1 Tax=Hippea maritima (strain ATCC 700847 / DSM 10411 / MH2) TaxID=760142 RepID=F2LUM3_HIPMA|nr:type II 3-dehydroquinate dehydratase [Hippea maritima]AEA34613.1 3-dehydroquinate dehydratase [Hippea maritima DSM 10411]